MHITLLVPSSAREAHHHGKTCRIFLFLHTSFASLVYHYFRLSDRGWSTSKSSGNLHINSTFYSASFRSWKKLGADTSEKAECTEIGLNMLKAGGNAADAMIVNVFCVGTVAAYHAGIGGGGFALVRSANGSKGFINFRESAPAAAFPNMFNQNVDLSLYGGLES